MVVDISGFDFIKGNNRKVRYFPPNITFGHQITLLVGHIWRKDRPERYKLKTQLVSHVGMERCWKVSTLSLADLLAGIPKSPPGEDLALTWECSLFFTRAESNQVCERRNRANGRRGRRFLLRPWGLTTRRYCGPWTEQGREKQLPETQEELAIPLPWARARVWGSCL